MRRIVAIWLGKIVSWTLRRLGKQGAALPGLIVERVYPRFLPKMLAQLPEGVVLVTGTNGKTTTTKMVTDLLRANGKLVLTNRTGGNFVRGIISTIIRSSTFSSKLPYDIAVFELDEAYAVKFVEQFRPRAVLALNVTRDQLDRFGEIDTTAKLIEKVVHAATELVVLNDDDRRLSVMKPDVGAKASYFGVSKDLQANFPSDEQLLGAKTKAIRKHNRSVELVEVAEDSAVYAIGAKNHKVTLNIEGQHNDFNLAAALGLMLEVAPEVKVSQLLKDVEELVPAFGRGEAIDYQGRNIILQLVKNPSSFRQALKVLELHQPKAVAILINDNYADGRDVSWLWDVDFSILRSVNNPVITGGVRSYDMATRLKYDGIHAVKATTSRKLLLNQLMSETKAGDTAVIFTTYTPMIRLRRSLGKKAGDVEV